jgi:hypothetical protein
MPLVGDIKTARDLGKGGEPANRFIWHACNQCGKCRWVQFVSGKPTHELCSHCAHSGLRASNYQTGRTRGKGGYIKVLISDNDFFASMRREDGYVLEHRLVMAKSLGRCLHDWEIVHHKNHVRSDNRIENLQLVSDDRHKQITILENRIRILEQRMTLLEAENVILRQELSART